MGIRKNFGDVVKLKKTTSMGQGEVGTVAVITNLGRIQENDINPCVLQCGDNDCREFDNLLTESGDWIYHVSEC